MHLLLEEGKQKIILTLVMRTLINFTIEKYIDEYARLFILI